ncbi:MAG: helix-turn-helix domain-containing protein [bacterium]
MIDADKRNAIFQLHKEGMGAREIARRLGLGRNTVRRVIALDGAMPPAPRREKQPLDPELLRRLYAECDGWIQRVHEKLTEEVGVTVPYQTLTRKLRAMGIGTARLERCDQVPDEPGAEMQHDTSVYPISLGDQRPSLIASLLYLRYSKRRYLRFYRAFNRFKMKCFFHEALMFWGYAARDCIIDNTNLARLRGTGADAVIIPEMEAFARQYAFRFQCHEKGHANRKAGEERSFWTVETNFLPGRTFQSIEDLNAQALDWSTTRMDHRPQGKARLIPAKAFEHERGFLTALPSHLPAPYLLHERDTDQYGYVAFGGNYYWVPGTARETVKALEYAGRLLLCIGTARVAEYPLPADGVRNAKFSPPGQPAPPGHPRNCKQPTQEEEKRLRAISPSVDEYLSFALKSQGVARHRFLREVFALSGQMATALFIRTVERALRYRIISVDTLRRIAQLCLNQGEVVLPSPQVDESFRDRDAYRQGHLTDAPDFSQYDKMLEDDDG